MTDDKQKTQPYLNSVGTSDDGRYTDCVPGEVFLKNTNRPSHKKSPGTDSAALTESVHVTENASPRLVGANGKTEQAGEVQRLASQANWLAANLAGDGLPASGSEYPLYSDSSVTGEISEGLGPYALLNALPMSNIGDVNVAIVFRVFFYEQSSWPGGVPRSLKTNVNRYHGGSLADEIAALCSLCLGIRLRAGNANRWFSNADPLGRFQAYQEKGVPSLTFQRSRPVVPNAIAVPFLNNVQPRLATIPNLNPSSFTELVKAARLYQDALWIAETDPHLSWLLLVSAVEIAANAFVTDSGSAVENLREYQPNLVAMLESAGGEALVRTAALELKDLYSATRKFLNFCEAFMPAAPPIRPQHAWMQIDWTWPKLKKILRTVYGHRSNALHAGIPFPAPMCRRPDRHDDADVVAEVGVTALAESTLGATWAPRDAPISLNAFHYFVREALLMWWDAIASHSTNDIAQRF